MQENVKSNAEKQEITKQEIAKQQTKRSKKNLWCAIMKKAHI